MYFPKKIITGVDGVGQIIFEYNDFNVVMQVGKICDSFATSEIHGEEGTLICDSIEYISEIKHSKKPYKNLANSREPINMMEEAEEFHRIINSTDKESYECLALLSARVHLILTDLRKNNHLIFQDDLGLNSET